MLWRNVFRAGHLATRVRTGKYSAQLKHQGKKIHIGTFPTLEEAEKAVIAMRLEIFTHSDGR